MEWKWFWAFHSHILTRIDNFFSSTSPKVREWIEFESQTAEPIKFEKKYQVNRCISIESGKETTTD